jgi:hypothetical protein
MTRSTPPEPRGPGQAPAPPVQADPDLHTSPSANGRNGSVSSGHGNLAPVLELTCTTPRRSPVPWAGLVMFTASAAVAALIVTAAAGLGAAAAKALAAASGVVHAILIGGFRCKGARRAAYQHLPGTGPDELQMAITVRQALNTGQPCTVVVLARHARRPRPGHRGPLGTRHHLHRLPGRPARRLGRPDRTDVAYGDTGRAVGPLRRYPPGILNSSHKPKTCWITRPSRPADKDRR